MSAIELVSPEEVLSVVKSIGPLQPLDVRKVLKRGDSIVIGAVLSGLVGRGLVKVTTVKRGGSPYYYSPGTESRLERVSEFLNEKDIRAYNLLKEKKILRDKSQEPLTRVALRAMKDYSRQFTFNVNGEEEIFWRYYLISENDALTAIKNAFSQKQKQSSEKIETPIVQIKPQKEETPVAESKSRVPVQNKQTKEVQTSIQDKQEDDETHKLFSETNDDFLKKLKKFFDSKGIQVKESKLIRKGSEYEFIIEMETPMGFAEYYCKAKSKKKCNDGDLSSAYLQGQTRRIPVVFITTGEVAKKAKEKTKTDYKGMLIKEI